MIILPISTDAPIYHWPFATVGLIIVNTLLYFLLPSLGDDERGAITHAWILWFGNGLHPLQWVTNIYLHADFIHLLGNMIFLWVFGIIVEGKVGWWRYLIIYHLIGVTESAFVQSALLWYPATDPVTGSLGASSAISGLMMIAMIWAPRNEIGCLVVIGIGFRGYGDIVDVSTQTFAGLYIVKELILAMFYGFEISSEVLHLSGAAVGAPIGLFMVIAKWVDCEGWDLISVFYGREGQTGTTPGSEGFRYVRTTQPSKKKKKKGRSEQADTPNTDPFADDHLEKIDEKIDQWVEKIKAKLAKKLPLAALNDYHRLLHIAPRYRLPRELLLLLTEMLFQSGAVAEAVPLMQECVDRFPRQCDRVRIHLAKMALDEERPRKALRMMSQVDDKALPSKLIDLKKQLQQRCQQLIDDGVMEPEATS